MAPTGHWWMLCAVSLSCFGSYRRGSMAEAAQPELFIFNELCALKDEKGLCKAALDRFFFNVDTGRCELFEYGGCGGNENNFKTLEACEETCVVSDDKNPCHLAEAAGPCRGLVTRYFFDTRTQQCKHFYYGGCFGNANNFRTMEQCRARCQNPVRPTKAPEVHTVSAREPSVENPIKVTGDLALSEPQVQTNDTIQETQDLTPAQLCSSPAEYGSCNGAERRYAFNPKTKRCNVFSYSGCGGNKNNFLSRRDCVMKCRGKMIRIRKKNIDLIARRAA